MESNMDTETGEMIVKRVSVPIGLEELMEGLVKEVLLKKPDDIYLFAARYFAHLLTIRDKSQIPHCKAKTLRSVQNFKEKPEKLTSFRTGKLSKQLSIREDPVETPIVSHKPKMYHRNELKYKRRHTGPPSTLENNQKVDIRKKYARSVSSEKHKPSVETNNNIKNKMRTESRGQRRDTITKATTNILPVTSAINVDDKNNNKSLDTKTDPEEEEATINRSTTIIEEKVTGNSEQEIVEKEEDTISEITSDSPKTTTNITARPTSPITVDSKTPKEENQSNKSVEIKEEILSTSKTSSVYSEIHPKSPTLSDNTQSENNSEEKEDDKASKEQQEEISSRKTSISDKTSENLVEISDSNEPHIKTEDQRPSSRESEIKEQRILKSTKTLTDEEISKILIASISDATISTDEKHKASPRNEEHKDTENISQNNSNIKDNKTADDDIRKDTLDAISDDSLELNDDYDDEVFLQEDSKEITTRNNKEIETKKEHDTETTETVEQIEMTTEILQKSESTRTDHDENLKEDSKEITTVNNKETETKKEDNTETNEVSEKIEITTENLQKKEPSPIDDDDNKKEDSKEITTVKNKETETKQEDDTEVAEKIEITTETLHKKESSSTDDDENQKDEKVVEEIIVSETKTLCNNAQTDVAKTDGKINSLIEATKDINQSIDEPIEVSTKKDSLNNSTNETLTQIVTDETITQLPEEVFTKKDLIDLDVNKGTRPDNVDAKSTKNSTHDSINELKTELDITSIETDSADNKTEDLCSNKIESTTDASTELIKKSHDTDKTIKEIITIDELVTDNINDKNNTDIINVDQEQFEEIQNSETTEAAEKINILENKENSNAEMTSLDIKPQVEGDQLKSDTLMNKESSMTASLPAEIEEEKIPKKDLKNFELQKNGNSETLSANIEQTSDRKMQTDLERLENKEIYVEETLPSTEEIKKKIETKVERKSENFNKENCTSKEPEIITQKSADTSITKNEDNKEKCDENKQNCISEKPGITTQKPADGSISDNIDKEDSNENTLTEDKTQESVNESESGNLGNNSITKNGNEDDIKKSDFYQSHSSGDSSHLLSEDSNLFAEEHISSGNNSFREDLTEIQEEVHEPQVVTNNSNNTNYENNKIVSTSFIVQNIELENVATRPKENQGETISKNDNVDDTDNNCSESLKPDNDNLSSDDSTLKKIKLSIENINVSEDKVTSDILENNIIENKEVKDTTKSETITDLKTDKLDLDNSEGNNLIVEVKITEPSTSTDSLKSTSGDDKNEIESKILDTSKNKSEISGEIDTVGSKIQKTELTNIESGNDLKEDIKLTDTDIESSPSEQERNLDNTTNDKQLATDADNENFKPTTDITHENLIKENSVNNQHIKTIEPQVNEKNITNSKEDIIVTEKITNKTDNKDTDIIEDIPKKENIVTTQNIQTTNNSKTTDSNISSQTVDNTKHTDSIDIRNTDKSEPTENIDDNQPISSENNLVDRVAKNYVNYLIDNDRLLLVDSNDQKDTEGKEKISIDEGDAENLRESDNSDKETSKTEDVILTSGESSSPTVTDGVLKTESNEDEHSEENNTYTIEPRDNSVDKHLDITDTTKTKIINDTSEENDHQNKENDTKTLNVDNTEANQINSDNVDKETNKNEDSNHDNPESGLSVKHQLTPTNNEKKLPENIDLTKTTDDLTQDIKNSTSDNNKTEIDNINEKNEENTENLKVTTDTSPVLHDKTKSEDGKNVQIPLPINGIKKATSFDTTKLQDELKKIEEEKSQKKLDEINKGSIPINGVKRTTSFDSGKLREELKKIDENTQKFGVGKQENNKEINNNKREVDETVTKSCVQNLNRSSKSIDDQEEAQKEHDLVNSTLAIAESGLIGHKVKKYLNDFINKEQTNVDKSHTNSFDSSKLREELQKVEEESKFTNFKTTFNPFLLHKEIEEATKANVNSTSESNNIRTIPDFTNLEEITKSVLRIQSLWRGFKTRQNIIATQQKNKETESVHEDISKNIEHTVQHNNNETGSVDNDTTKNIKEEVAHMSKNDTDTSDRDVTDSPARDKRETKEDNPDFLATAQAALLIQKMWRAYKKRQTSKDNNKKMENQLVKNSANNNDSSILQQDLLEVKPGTLKDEKQASLQSASSTEIPEDNSIENSENSTDKKEITSLFSKDSTDSVKTVIHKDDENTHTPNSTLTHFPSVDIDNLLEEILEYPTMQEQHLLDNYQNKLLDKISGKEPEHYDDLKTLEKIISPKLVDDINLPDLSSAELIKAPVLSKPDPRDRKLSRSIGSKLEILQEETSPSEEDTNDNKTDETETCITKQSDIEPNKINTNKDDVSEKDNTNNNIQSEVESLKDNGSKSEPKTIIEITNSPNKQDDSDLTNSSNNIKSLTNNEVEAPWTATSTTQLNLKIDDNKKNIKTTELNDDHSDNTSNNIENDAQSIKNKKTIIDKVNNTNKTDSPTKSISNNELLSNLDTTDTGSDKKANKINDSQSDFVSENNSHENKNLLDINTEYKVNTEIKSATKLSDIDSVANTEKTNIDIELPIAATLTSDLKSNIELKNNINLDVLKLDGQKSSNKTEETTGIVLDHNKLQSETDIQNDQTSTNEPEVPTEDDLNYNENQNEIDTEPNLKASSNDQEVNNEKVPEVDEHATTTDEIVSNNEEINKELANNQEINNISLETESKIESDSNTEKNTSDSRGGDTKLEKTNDEKLYTFCSVPTPISGDTKPLSADVELLPSTKNIKTVDKPNNRKQTPEKKDVDYSIFKSGNKMQDTLVIPLPKEVQKTLKGENEVAEELKNSTSIENVSSILSNAGMNSGELHDTVVVPVNHLQSIDIGRSQPIAVQLCQTAGQVFLIIVLALSSDTGRDAENVTSQRPPSPADDVSDAGVEERNAQNPGKGDLLQSKAESGSSVVTSVSQPESMESEKRRKIDARNMEAEAATKIQAGFRGYQVRKQLKLKNGSSDMNTRRSSLKSKTTGSLDNSKNASQQSGNIEEQSATKIQAGIRGFLVRRRQKKQYSQQA